MKKGEIFKLLKYAAILGNALYILWMLYNAMDEGTTGVGPVQLIAITGLIILLSLNIVLLSRRNKF